MLNDRNLCKNVLWFKLHSYLSGHETLCGAVYIEPEGSKYATPDCFEIIENDIVFYNRDHVILIGDFNSRTHNVMLNDLGNDRIWLYWRL